MVKPRRGASTFGCLFIVLLGVAAVYFGLKIGQVYWNNYSYEDAMKQQLRFAETLTDKQIYDRIVPSQSVRTALDYLLEPLVSSFWTSVREN